MQACKGTPGREIAPNTGVNATKSFTFVTKSGKILHSPILHYVSGAQFLSLPLGKQICLTKVWGCVEIFTKKIFKDKFAANFLVKFVSKTQHMHLDR